MRGKPKLVRGDKLSPALQAEVLRGYLYRWTSDNKQREHAWDGIQGKPTMPLVTDDQWLREHAFYVTTKGELSRRYKSCEPAFMVDSENE